MSGLEEWRPIKGYEGLYEVSSFGRVKSLPKTCPRKTKKGRSTGLYVKSESTIMKQYLSGHGYFFVTLSKGGVKNHALIHRLVAEAFLDENLSSSGLVVNHLDSIKHHNHRDNLEVISYAENKWHSLKYFYPERVREWLFNTTDQQVYCSIAEAAYYLRTSEEKVLSAVETGRKINGCHLAKTNLSAIQYLL